MFSDTSNRGFFNGEKVLSRHGSYDRFRNVALQKL